MAKTNNNNDFWRWFKRVQLFFWSAVVIAILFFTGINYGLLGEMPDLEAIQDPNNSVSTTVFSADLEVLGSYYNENRIEISYDQLSPYLVKGLVATEDKRFYDHSGIDIRGLFAAILVPIFTGNDRGGASTLSQQLAKNLFHQNFSIAGRLGRAKQKLKEWVLAAKIERMFSKDEIIAMYFNTVGFGYNSYGIKTAAFTYFGKTPKELNPEEAALLIGLLNAPGRFNPVKHPEKATERRNVVLRRMAEAQIITTETADKLQAKKINLEFHNPDYREGIATYLREQIRQDLKAWCDNHYKADGTKYDIYKDGLNVYTTIDSRMQTMAEDAMKKHIIYMQKVFFKEWKGKEPWKFGSRAKPDLLDKMMKQSERYLSLKAAGKRDFEIKKEFETKVAMNIYSPTGDIDTIMSPLDSLRYYLQMMQVGFMAMDATSGEIKAWIGGPDIHYFQLDHAKKSTKRQVGSTMKPLQYAVAIDRGWEPCTEIAYLPPNCGTGNWNPAGTKRWKDGDMVAIQEGLWYSDNRMTANLVCEFGPDALVEMARKLKIESDLEAVPALSLGTSDISLYEMVSAYSSFANLGIQSTPFYIKRITDKNGKVLAEFHPEQTQTLPENVAYTTNEMMKGVVKYGTGKKLSNYGLGNMAISGKTGTTQSNSDAWFIAITPQLITGCWVGFEQPSVHFASTTTGQGGAAALPIVGGFLQRVYSDGKLPYKRSLQFPVMTDSTAIPVFDCNQEIILPNSPDIP